ncbi:MAG: LysM peptidoglycan-binding domain-containing protein [Bacteroidia bacterium]
MDNESLSKILAEGYVPPQAETPSLTLDMEDVSSLDKVLRGYYLSQIKKIDTRKGRKQARKLLENHLVLPKSRQRTSKDAAYIHEVIDMDPVVLSQLEQFRLIRRLDKGGQNPIYEVSHDTLVEPILAERSNREAIKRFFKKYGKYFLLLLLLLFICGMIFENTLDIIDDDFAFGKKRSSDKIVNLKAQNRIVASRGVTTEYITVPFGDIDAYRKDDSLTLRVGVEVIAHPDLDSQTGGDTLDLDLGPVAIPLSRDALQALINAKRDTALEMSTVIPVGDGGLMAAVRGTALLRLGSDDESMMPRGINQRTRGGAGNLIEANFGRRFVQAISTTQRVKLDTIISLAELVKDDQVAYDVLKNRRLRLLYEVDVSAVPEKSPTQIVDYLPVSGIELQYPDGTKKLISGGDENARRAITHTVQAGETLYQISKRYGVSAEEIQKLNNLTDNNLKVGQVLRIK